jgi:hypothetical protein
VVPAPTVRVVSLFIKILPVRLYGLFVFVHVVSDLIMPLTGVEVCASPKDTLLIKANPLIIRAINSIVKVSFGKTIPKYKYALKEIKYFF